ncbi:MAG TPA: TetR/AcrR family transcriptional regulator [Pseudonocardiaceae bacterium]
MAPTAAERGEQVRQQLLRTAAELIAERGWTAVSTRVLAERAGVAAGLVHYHFASLPALLREAALGGIGAAVTGLDVLLEQARTPEELLGLLLGTLDQYTGHDSMSLLFTETYLAATRDEDLRRELGTFITDFVQKFARWLEDHGVPEPRQTATVLAAALDGVLLHHSLNPDLTAALAAPVLNRILAPTTAAGRRRHRKAGED